MSKKKKPLIPFKVWPGSYHLKGKMFDEAEAYYNLDGEDLDRRLAEINHTGVELEKKLLAIDLKYGHLTPELYDMKLLKFDGLEHDARAQYDVQRKHGQITDLQYDENIARLDHRKGTVGLKIALIHVAAKHGRRTAYDAEREIAELENPDEPAKTLAVLTVDQRHNKITDLHFDTEVAKLTNLDDTARELALLDVQYRHKEIGETEYEKSVATVKEEPWVGIIDSGFDPDKGINGVFFELDWNEFWIDFLRLNGYTGVSDAAMVDQWFSDVCRAQGVASMLDNNNVVPFGGIR